MILMHISPCRNRESIFKTGLMYVDKPSSYGNPPAHEAVYLYHHDNINIIYDMLNTFEIFDVYEVSGIETEYLLPDEDSGEGTWEESLNNFGTVAYKRSIPAENIKIMCTVHNPNFKENQ